MIAIALKSKMIFWHNYDICLQHDTVSNEKCKLDDHLLAKQFESKL